MKKRITIVEDNKPDVALLEDALVGAGVDVELNAFNDGVAAKRHLEGIQSEEQVPDLILLDLNIPKVEGLSLLRRIRERDHLQRVPVVVWSSILHMPDATAASLLDIRDFIEKPRDLEGWDELAHKLGEILQEAT